MTDQRDSNVMPTERQVLADDPRDPSPIVKDGDGPDGVVGLPTLHTEPAWLRVDASFRRLLRSPENYLTPIADLRVSQAFVEFYDWGLHIADPATSIPNLPPVTQLNPRVVLEDLLTDMTNLLELASIDSTLDEFLRLDRTWVFLDSAVTAQRSAQDPQHADGPTPQ